MRPEFTNRLSAWLSPATVPTDHRINVFCFPFAGGGASFYRAWLPLAPATIALCPLQPPGREERFGEPPFTSMVPLVRAASDALSPFLSRPYAFFGHSMGALASFEIAHELRARGAPLPVHLFVSGAPAPHLASRIPPIHDRPEGRFLDAMQRYGGLPGEVLRSRRKRGCRRAAGERRVMARAHRGVEPVRDPCRRALLHCGPRALDRLDDRARAVVRDRLMCYPRRTPHARGRTR